MLHRIISFSCRNCCPKGYSSPQDVPDDGSNHQIPVLLLLRIPKGTRFIRRAQSRPNFFVLRYFSSMPVYCNRNTLTFPSVEIISPPAASASKPPKFSVSSNSSSSWWSWPGGLWLLPHWTQPKSSQLWPICLCGPTHPELGSVAPRQQDLRLHDDILPLQRCLRQNIQITWNYSVFPSAVETQLISTGAFEITLNDMPVKAARLHSRHDPLCLLRCGPRLRLAEYRNQGSFSKSLRIRWTWRWLVIN